MSLVLSVITQTITFLPLAFGISISYRILRATDMTIDGSFVLGAVIYAQCIVLGYSPYLAFLCAILSGALAGMMVAGIQRHGKIDPLLAGILATFILSSFNLIIMGKPNINLLAKPSLVSFAFEKNELYGWAMVSIYTGLLCSIAYAILKTKLGLALRAFGDNPNLLARLGRSNEWIRSSGFALTNMLAAGSGCLTAQTVGYADIGMGLGMTLTGIGAIILGQQIFNYFKKENQFRLSYELFSCLLGALVYFFSINILLRFDINPIYLKMILGFLLIFFLRAASARFALGENR